MYFTISDFTFTGDKPHECPVCQKKFALHCNLKTHLKTHEGKNLCTFKVNDLSGGNNSAIFLVPILLNEGQLLKERICSWRSKFFLLRVDPCGTPF